MILKRLLFGISKRTMAIDIGGMRKPYLGENQAFEVKDLVAKEPFAQFQNWFDQAKETPGIEEANAMCVASASKAGIPSARYVLLKVSRFKKEYFRFYCILMLKRESSFTK